MTNIQIVGSAWLFHVGNRYYITHDFDDDLCDLSSDAVPVDELIAEPLMILCNKGYITEYSCSGHPFNSCCYNVIEDDINNHDTSRSIIITPFTDTGAQAVCYIDSEIEDEMYISFANQYEFQTLPTGWIYQGNAIRAKIQAGTVIEFYKKAIALIESLLEWIQLLPAI